jgi:HEAT repeat protein
MTKSDLIEQALDRLSELRSERTPAAVEEFRHALKHRSNLVAAKAAKIAGELRVTDLVPDLVSCFERFMAHPAKLDKRCAAVTEVVAALYDMDYLDPAIYLRGIRHVQLEASFGPPVDEAAKLRAQCALALVRTLHPEAMPRIVDLLADPQPQARIGAIRALAACGGERGALLLRFKAHVGDRDPEVFGECLAGLLDADFDGSLELVKKFVDADDDEIAEVAILTLGQQRRPEAFAVVREKWARTVDPSLRKTLLTAMATARIDEATEFLIHLVADTAVPTATEIIKVLARLHNDERVRERVKAAVEERGAKQLMDVFRQEFQS